jgi:outer membrane protein insertion porin family
MDVADGERGKIVTFRVSERKRVREIRYEGSGGKDARKLDAELRARGQAPVLGSLYDKAEAEKSEEAVRAILRRKGYAFATVRLETEDVPTGLRLRFHIDPGRKTEVHEVVFRGAREISENELRGALRGLKPKGFWDAGWITGSTVYSAEKWAGGDGDPGDRARLLDLYRSRGFIDVRIGDPTVTAVGAETSGESARRVRIEIPIVEGDRYWLGELRFEGLTVVSEAEARPLFGLARDDVYDASRIGSGQAALRDLYGHRGYFQATTTVELRADPETKRVALVVSAQEDRLYSVGAIRFAGNDTTRDKVLRRQVLLSEGDAFDAQALRDSIRRIDRLGYFRPTEPPRITASPRTEGALDVSVRVREESPTRFLFGGGVSQAKGTFVDGSFSTTNKLGFGEMLELNAESGTRTRNFSLGITQPYLFDRSASGGFDVFNRRQTYRSEPEQGVVGYRDERSGGGLSSSLPVGRWSRASLGYSFQRVDIGSGDSSSAAANGAAGLAARDLGRFHHSTLSPSFVRSTLDRPALPRRGTRLTLSLPVSGGPLGGSVDILKPRLEGVAYFPHGTRTTFALRTEASWVRPFGDTATGNGLPFYERFFLGGETQVRGYDFRTIGPRDIAGQAIGGTKYMIFNAEYSWDIVHPLRLVAFGDAGEAYAANRPMRFSRLKLSTGLELRVLLPILNVPLRLIYAWNLNREPYHRANALKFAIGTAF